MNARSESVGQKQSFGSAWNKLNLALIPCSRFYEPNYETGKAVRWRIGMADGAPFAIAGLWRAWKEEGGAENLSMTMLTVRAEEHPLMKRFHRPDAVKRSVVIIPPTEYEAWLSCRNTDEARSFLQLYPVEAMYAEAYPLPPRAGKSTVAGEASPAQASLLADDGG
jgi:putative SOS response-associated peptidase YedK